MTTITEKESELVKCVACRGEKCFYTGTRDPIEGNKMRGTIDCPICRGVGTIWVGTPAGKAAKAYWEVFDSEENALRRREEEARTERKRLRESGIRKLTLEELEALGIDTEQK